jgi:hypothetical protein
MPKLSAFFVASLLPHALSLPGGASIPKQPKPSDVADATKNFNKCKITGGADCSQLLGDFNLSTTEVAQAPKNMVASYIEGCTLSKQACQELAKQAMKNLTGKDLSNQDAAVAVAEAARSNLAATLQACITAASTSDAKKACHANSTTKAAYAASLGRDASSITDVDIAKAARDGAKSDVSDYIQSCLAQGNSSKACMKPNKDLKQTISDATGVDTSSLKDSSVQRFLDKASRDQALEAAQACNDTASNCREAARKALAATKGGNVSDAVLSKTLRSALLGDVADSMQACVADAGSNTTAFKLCISAVTADIQAATFRNSTPSPGEIKRILKEAGVKKVQETAELCNLTRDECRSLQRQALAQSLGQSVSDVSTADVELSNKAAALSSGADTVRSCVEAREADSTSTCDDPYQAVLSVRQTSMPGDNLSLGIDKAQVYQSIVAAQQQEIQSTCYDLTTKADADACLANFSSQLQSTAVFLFSSADSTTQAQKLQQAQTASTIDVLGERYDACMSAASSDSEKDACQTDLEAKQDVAGVTSTGVIVNGSRRLAPSDPKSKSKDTLTKHSMSLVASGADSCNKTDRQGCMKSIRDSLEKNGYRRGEFASATRLALVQSSAQTWAACAEVQGVSKTLTSVDGATAPTCDGIAAQRFLDLAGQSTNITMQISQKIRKLGFGLFKGDTVQLRYRNEVVIDMVTDAQNCSDAVMNATVNLVTAKATASGKAFKSVSAQGCTIIFGAARYMVVIKTPALSTTEISDLSTRMTADLNNTAVPAASRRLQSTSVTVTDTYAAQGSDACATGDATCGIDTTTTTTMAYFVTNVTTTTKMNSGAASFSQRQVLMVLPNLALVLMPFFI